MADREGDEGGEAWQEARGGPRALEVRAGGGAGRRRADSAACAAAAAVIGSHHRSAIFTVSPPISPDCLLACRVSSEREREQQGGKAARMKGWGRARDGDQIASVKAK